MEDGEHNRWCNLTPYITATPAKKEHLRQECTQASTIRSEIAKKTGERAAGGTGGTPPSTEETPAVAVGMAEEAAGTGAAAATVA